jgi:hypothetical protein
MSTNYFYEELEKIISEYNFEIADDNTFVNMKKSVYSFVNKLYDNGFILKISDKEVNLENLCIVVYSENDNITVVFNDNRYDVMLKVVFEFNSVKFEEI